MDKVTGNAQPAINLPKGGGALKGIGETFQPDPFSGTGNFTIPIAVSPGRGGFAPSLTLQYSSGNGNGPFGLGWKLSLPRISRKTEKGLPRYDDTDVFVMSGAEDLVPYLEKTVAPGTGQDVWIPEDPIDRPSHTVRRYRPRTEGLFARIERWQSKTTSEVHWRTITKDNITSVYGGTAASRIADPADDRQVFEWLLQETFDAAGNHILYEYARDNPLLYTGDDPELHLPETFEQNRNATQLYVRRICYGNLPEPLVDEHGRVVVYPDGAAVGCLRGGRRYAFEVIFDYGDWDATAEGPHPDPGSGEQELFGPDPSITSEHNSVPVRDDRFSSFRARFEIRTLRRCHRVLMFHHFAELGGPAVVRSTDFEYRVDPGTRLSTLSAVTVTGYRKDPSGRYSSAAMPPVVFEYSEFRPHEQRCRAIDALGHDMPPVGLDDPNVAVVDLFGDGLPDVLHGSAAGFRYWRNLGGGLLDRPRSLPQVPAGIALAQPGVGFGDMAGDGQIDLLVHSGPLPGFFETSADGAWQTFRAYAAFPSFDLQDPNVRLIDLTGDGLSDALMTEDDDFVWFECLGEQGFGAPNFVRRTPDLDNFPDVSFADPSGRVRLADMTGSGLNDIVLLHNGRIDYWPNLGYGHFGKRITMADAPRLEAHFDPGRLFLADLNGTGCADLVYVDFDRVHFWFNQCGNAWSGRETLHGTPPVSDLHSVRFADVFGTGTATLLWSNETSLHRGSNYQALDFCGGVKPYVLVEMRNNIGATTRVTYAPSTRYFLEDQASGTPWITKLPFPVHVVDEVEVLDDVSRTRLVTTYRYHHGYFDGREREFRGFGRVDQFDTQTFAEFARSASRDADAPGSNGSPAYHVPPVETRSWFHTGVYFDDGQTTRGGHPFDCRTLTGEFRKEFYQADREAAPIDEHAVAATDTPHEAYRALRGALLRTEVYGRDGSAKADHPYQVTETRHRVDCIQPNDGGRHGVYLTYPVETLSCQYERNPADPRQTQTLTLEVDGYGNPVKSLAIAYGRRLPDPLLPTDADRQQQTRMFITLTERSYTNAIDDPAADPDNYRTPLVYETRTYELTGFRPADDAKRFTLDEWVRSDFARLNRVAEISYEETSNSSSEQKRLLERVRMRFRRNDLTGLLPLGVVEPLAIAGESHKLAFTSGLLTKAYDGRVTPSMLAGDGGYRQDPDGSWWIPSGRVFLSPEESDSPAAELAFARRHFFSPHRSRDPFGQSGVLRYDAYQLCLEETVDPLGNRTRAEQDYRLLQTFRLIDPNGNRTEVAFDTLGLVAGTAVMGKAEDSKGDSLAGFVADLTQQQRRDFFADPLRHAAALLGPATTRIVYDLDRYIDSRQPVLAATIARETHASDPLPPHGLRVQVSVSYSDGFGREVQKKIQAEPGPIADGGPSVSPRWVGTGWTIFDNKGQAIKRYEPFFDDTAGFRFNRRVGVSSTLFHDPLERVVATLHANHTWEKAVFDPWQQETWDVNDTVLIDPGADPDVGEFFRRLPPSEFLPTWHAQRQSGSLGVDEKTAAAQTAVHAATPSVTCADSLGRTFLTIAHNRVERNGAPVDEKYPTRVIRDIEGNECEVIDANDRIVMRYDYDMLASRIHSASMEAGERWTLNDVAGQAIHAWDSRGHHFRTAYDALRRPTEMFLREASGSEHLIGRTIYGESLTNPAQNNQRGKVAQLFDQAGVVTSDAYDFKGNLLASRRQFAREYRSTLDWSANPELVPETFTSTTTYDALNRPVTTTSPDGSIHRPTFNESNLLERIDVSLRGEETVSAFVTGIDYDARGQRVRIEYGNGVETRYVYDPLSLRLTGLVSTRRSGETKVQDLAYVYDAGGNITHIRDRSQQAIYFSNQPVSPHGTYTYDALYRLIAAEGREHIGQNSPAPTSWDDRFLVHLPHPGDGAAMRRYTEKFAYDAVGNIRRLIHQAANGNWTRSYAYDEPSLIEPGRMSNRLSRAVVGGGVPESYTYDSHGSVQRMPHLTQMEWSFTDQLQHIDLAGGGDAYYIYDAAGQRVRKVVERTHGTLVEETFYLGGFELYRRRSGAGNTTLARETLHVMDATRRVALVESRTEGHDEGPARLIRYQFTNHLGSASLELDARADVISYEEYYAYGSTSYQAVRSQLETPKRYRYTAMERDEESGFSYHNARYFAPWLAVWTSCDPIGSDGGLNLYRYASNRPLQFVDATGEQPDNPDNIGNVAPYNRQPAAGRDATGARTTESEHVIPKGNLQELTRDPTTGRSDYTDSHYRKDTTVRIERATALNKTHGSRGGATADNPSTGRLRRTARSGGRINYREDVFNRAVANALRSVVATGSRVLAGQIHQAALAQDGNLFALQKLQESGRIVARGGSTIHDTPDDLEFDLVKDARSPGKTGGPPEKGVRPSRSVGGIVVNVALALPGFATAVRQFRSGQRLEAAKTVGWTVAGMIPTTMPVAGAKAVSDTFDANRGGIMERGTWLAEHLDPGMLIGVRTPIGGIVAATYAVAESTARTAAEPVVGAGLAIGEGYARPLIEKYRPKDLKAGEYWEPPVNPGMGHR